MGKLNDCAGCSHELIPGVRFATRGDGHRAIERCDTCERYESDDEAFGRVERYIQRIERYDAARQAAAIAPYGWSHVETSVED